MSGREDELLDTLYRTLADLKRRRVLKYLSMRQKPVSTGELSAALTAPFETAGSPADASQRLREVHLSLVHVHLPVLEDAGLVSWDRAADTVAIAPVLDELVVSTSGNVLDVSVSVENVR